MGFFGRRLFLSGVLAGCAALFALTIAGAAPVPRTLAGSFAFPNSLANGVSGTLVAPAGSTSKLGFDTGMVAIGQLPSPLRVRAGSLARRRRSLPQSAQPADAAPHVRLLLNGVVDSGGSAVTNTGNQLAIDAVVSPSDAGTPPFVVPFDINDGNAFVDAPLPIQMEIGRGVQVQVLGVTLIDPDNQPFAVLGFGLSPAPPTRMPLATPTPGGPPPIDGECFAGPNCTGPSFPASQQKCCLFNRPGVQGAPQPQPGFSWCPADQFDPSTGKCAANTCIACGPVPPPADCGDRPTCAGACTVQCPDGRIQQGVCQHDLSCSCSAGCEEPPTPTPGPCADGADCSGPCVVTCADGTTVAGQCVGGASNRCECSVACAVPTPCGGSQCFDTITQRCTGQPCGPGMRCALPNQLCDISGRRCLCEPSPPPLPHGHICCECKSPGPACFDFSFVEVQPACPPGCETFVGQACDPASDTCAPLAPCATDKDCDDGNGCTIDQCTPDGCTHECVCVGPGGGCGPGPSRGGHP
jgi:hypothetical protein